MIRHPAFPVEPWQVRETCLGYGYPESGQTIVNVTNGKLIRLLVDDAPFDMRDGVLRHHERVLDLRSGLLHREVEWESGAGRAVRVRSTRLVSFDQRSSVPDTGPGSSCPRIWGSSPRGGRRDRRAAPRRGRCVRAGAGLRSRVAQGFRVVLAVLGGPTRTASTGPPVPGGVTA
jgi:hypothetical protein